MSINVKSSDKAFGLFFAFLFSLLATLAFVKNHSSIALTASVVSALLILTSVFQPGKLRPLNVAWAKLSTTLSRVTSPVIMGLMFVSLFVPIAIIGKLRGRDELQLKFSQLPSYWTDVDPDHSKDFSFINQY